MSFFSFADCVCHFCTMGRGSNGRVQVTLGTKRQALFGRQSGLTFDVVVVGRVANSDAIVVRDVKHDHYVVRGPLLPAQAWRFTPWTPLAKCFCSPLLRCTLACCQTVCDTLPTAVPRMVRLSRFVCVRR